jgi:hypothetical protein
MPENINNVNNYTTDIEATPDTQFFDKKSFNKDSTEYKIIENSSSEDPASIVLEMLRRNKIDTKFIAFMRYSDAIANI